MKLEKIKLSGFKSFVDPTTIPITSNLTSIVGPNGCGKSNIIDAVRWVMGESSAKHLRGGSMTDVIFNGSSSRKPVSTASVELVFDNSEGKLGGEYAKYNQISIKRQVNRDGQSLYLLNSSRCRRKDITDIFLGTGLGARSYAIIEQGTISRMVEAKPDELRVHIEEAAGISKYKERRHETETRMRHTRENLERLEDLREEVGKQLNHLEKQSKKAEKYTELKKQERQFKLELMTMRWNSFHQSAQDIEQKLQAVAIEHNNLFTQVRELEANIELKRNEHKVQQQKLNLIQGDYYNVVSDVSRLEQTVKHNQQTHAETEQEILRLKQQADESKAELESDVLQLEEIKQNLLETEEELTIAQEAEAEASLQQEQVLQEKADWQIQWQAYHSENAKFKEQAEVARVKAAQSEAQKNQLQGRLEKLQNEQNELNDTQLQLDMEVLESQIEQIENQRVDIQQNLERQHQTIKEHRLNVKQYHDELHGRRSELHAVNGKLTSLEMLQQHAMGKDNKNLTAWLEKMSLNTNQRLAEFLEVDSGWESAVEIVLGGYLDAICTESAENVFQGLDYLKDESLALFETGYEVTAEPEHQLISLQTKVKAPWALTGLLTGVYCADDLSTARLHCNSLQAHESIVLADGTWLGPGWLKIIRAKDNKTGVLQREKELRSLKQRKTELQAEIDEFEFQLEQSDSELKQAEIQRENLQQQDRSLSTELSVQSAEFSAQSARMEQQQRRLAQVCHDIEEIVQEIAVNAEQIAESELLQQQAQEQIESQDNKREQLEQSYQTMQSRQQQVDAAVQEARMNISGLRAKFESLRSSELHTQKQIERLESLNQQNQARLRELETKREQSLSPIDAEKQQLSSLQQDKDRLEQQLKTERLELESTEQGINQLSEQLVKTQQAMDKHKASLDKLRFEQQESQVRQQTVTEQLNELDADAEQILAEISEQADEAIWKQKVDELTAKIEKLGTINLTAIEEFKSQSERMSFLNEQHSDLNQALDTLNQAIDKIDKESRLRFKETFDKINNGLQEKFPKLFGGGQAYLQLTEQDLLESGVNIIARPPGKRNSSIHLLSGGEKALTAVALVFSIFELNPAPFCLLDEVDAPLDDANVGRFSKMVEDMSSAVQFLFISHNKATMEIAKQLAGVTMKEPGVSRMVAVDIDEAVSLAES